MKNVVSIETFQKKVRDAEEKKRRVAINLLYEASLILSELQETDQRVAWMVEDCADLLSGEAARTESNQTIAVDR